MYSSNNEVLDKSKASLLGLLNAKAVPIEDFGFAPISVEKNILCGIFYGANLDDTHYFATNATPLFFS